MKLDEPVVARVGRRPAIAKIANSRRHIARERKMKGTDLKAVRSTRAILLPPAPRLGCACAVVPAFRVAAVRKYGMKHAAPSAVMVPITNAIRRIDHAHPRFGKVDLSIIGIIIEPVEDPVRAIPIATPRLRTKYEDCAITDTARAPRMAPPAAPKTLRQSMNCQY